MRLADYIRVLQRNWLLVVLPILLGVIGGTVVSLATPPEFMATARAFVSPGTAASTADLNQGGTYVQQVVKSYADVATTPFVLNPVIRDLRLKVTSSELARRVDASAALDTVTLDISVTDSSPARAAAIANAVTRRLAAAVTSLTPSATPSAAVKVTQIETATADTTPITPKPLLNALLGFITGLIVGLTLAIARDRLDTRVRGSDDVAQLTDKPLLGHILFDRTAAIAPLVLQDHTNGVRAEAFRSLRTNLAFLDVDDAVRTIVVTSAIAGEGKSTTAANLAITLAESAGPVLLIDADLRRPSVSDYFSIDGTVGLTDVLSRKVSLGDAVQTWGDGSLSILPRGSSAPNPSQLVQSQSMLDFLIAVEAQYETVIMDSPPLLAVSDAAVLARRAGGAIVVSAAGKVKRAQVAAALSGLDQVGARVLGVVVTMLPRRGPDADPYRAYGYGYREFEAKTGQLDRRS